MIACVALNFDMLTFCLDVVIALLWRIKSQFTQGTFFLIFSAMESQVREQFIDFVFLIISFKTLVLLFFRILVFDDLFLILSCNLLL